MIAQLVKILSTFQFSSMLHHFIKVWLQLNPILNQVNPVNTTLLYSPL